jgi:hypothetical protein
MALKPSPSWPLKFAPQHFAAPPVAMAHVWPRPASSTTTPLERPDTSTGVKRELTDPSPNWPLKVFAPTLGAAAGRERAGVHARSRGDRNHADREARNVGRNRMPLGRGVVPELPEVVAAQHFTPPPEVRAQVWIAPAAIAVTPLESPETSTGVSRSVREPSPSCP